MSKKANPALVGAFTFGALILLVAIFLVFGSERFMRPAVDCVLYFDGSVEGLDVGAPVLYRGVKIGAVKNIKLVYDAAVEEFRIPVTIELYKDSSVQNDGEGMLDAEWLRDLVKKGARAQLKSQSLLTGKLNITMDFYPTAEARYATDHTGLVQIPTIPTPFQAFYNKIADLPLEEIVQDVRRAMQGISELVNSDDTRVAMNNLNEALMSVKSVMTAVETEFVPVAKNVNETIGSAQKSLEAATAALRRIEDSLDTDSPVRYELSQLLVALKEAAQNFAALTDTIDRHPESLLKGKNQKERY